MVACIEFFEMSEICRPKFIVRHSTNIFEAAFCRTQGKEVEGFDTGRTSSTYIRVHYISVL
jgi:hypothetical protein